MLYQGCGAGGKAQAHVRVVGRAARPAGLLQSLCPSCPCGSSVQQGLHSPRGRCSPSDRTLHPVPGLHPAGSVTPPVCGLHAWRRDCVLGGSAALPAAGLFPGGKREAADGGAEGTALREAREELGLKLREESVWGRLRGLPERHGMLVVPVVANLGPLEDLTLSPNPDEVAEVFTLPLEHLLREENQGYTHFRTAGRYGYTLPVFLNGPHRIWGLTAIITELTLELLAPDLYCRKTHVPGRGITAPQKRA